MTDGGSNARNFVRSNANSVPGAAQQDPPFMFPVSNRLRHLNGDIRVKHGIVRKNSVIMDRDSFAFQVFDNLCLQFYSGVISADRNWLHVLLFRSLLFFPINSNIARFSQRAKSAYFCRRVESAW